MTRSQRDTVMLVAAPALGFLCGAECAFVIASIAFNPRDGSPIDPFFWPFISGHALFSAPCGEDAPRL
jgi:hypothetical protein